MHGVANTSSTALAPTRPNRPPATRLSALLCDHRVQALATAIVDFARRHPGLTVAALVATMFATSLAAHASVTMLTQRLLHRPQTSASVEPEPEVIPPTVEPVAAPHPTTPQPA